MDQDAEFVRLRARVAALEVYAPMLEAMLPEWDQHVKRQKERADADAAAAAEAEAAEPPATDIGTKGDGSTAGSQTVDSSQGSATQQTGAGAQQTDGSTQQTGGASPDTAAAGGPSAPGSSGQAADPAKEASPGGNPQQLP